MKKFYVAVLFVLTFFCASCEKKTDVQKEVDKVLVEYEKVVNEFSSFIEYTKDLTADKLPEDKMNELVGLVMKAVEVSSKFKKFDDADFTQKQKEKLEALTLKIEELQEIL